MKSNYQAESWRSIIVKSGTIIEIDAERNARRINQGNTIPLPTIKSDLEEIVRHLAMVAVYKNIANEPVIVVNDHDDILHAYPNDFHGTGFDVAHIKTLNYIPIKRNNFISKGKIIIGNTRTINDYLLELWELHCEKTKIDLESEKFKREYLALYSLKECD